MTSDSSRRAMALAAAAGLGFGLSACKGKEGPSEGATTASASKAPSAMVAAEAKDKDCCIGKNDCKGKGGCAVPESHACAGKNDCKGKGGCNMHCPQ